MKGPPRTAEVPGEGAARGWRARLAGAHADLWAVGLFFALSRFHWIVAQYYHQHPYAHLAIGATALATLILVALGYLITAVAGAARIAVWLRATLLAMLLFFAMLQIRYAFFPSVPLGGALEGLLMIAGLGLALWGARLPARFWPRLRAALLVAATFATVSGPVLVAILGKRIDILPNAAAQPRPVLALLLDELSAGAARDIVAQLRGRDLQVSEFAVPSVGKNTIDVIPAILSGHPLPDAITCSASAVCGSSRIVDFSRIHVGRPDVDFVGIYHRYCAIQGLRYCANPEPAKTDAPVYAWFLCALPLRFVLDPLLDCAKPGRLAQPVRTPLNIPGLFEAPFWANGGVLYVHLRLPHPPGAANEPRLIDAYSHNLQLAAQLTKSMVDRLQHGPLADDFVLIVTSDHHLRTDYWCGEEPYKSHDCTVPAEMRTAEVPFVIAAPRAQKFAAPRSNGDLFAVIESVAAR